MKKTGLFFIVVVIIAGGIFSCDLFDKSDLGTLVVRLPGSGTARSAAFENFVETLKYQIDCTNGSETIGNIYSPGEAVTISLSAGTWVITLKALDKEDYTIGEYTETVDIKPGKTTTVNMNIKINTQNTSITNFVLKDVAFQQMEITGEETIKITVLQAVDISDLQFTVEHTGKKISHFNTVYIDGLPESWDFSNNNDLLVRVFADYDETFQGYTLKVVNADKIPLTTNNFTVTDGDTINREYNRSPQTVAVNFSGVGVDATTAGTITVYYVSKEGTTYDSATPPTNAGTYGIEVSTEGGTTFASFSRAPLPGVTLTVSRISLTWSNGTVHNKSYDTTTTATVNTPPTLIGVLDGDIDTVTIIEGDVNFAQVNAADDLAVTASNWGIGGTSAANYNAPTLQPVFANANITKANGAEVNAPTEFSKTPTSITVNTMVQPSTGQTVQYAISTASNGNGLSTWQPGTTFNDLIYNTTYFVYARSAENINYNAGAYSASAPIITLQGTYTVSFNPNIDDRYTGGMNNQTHTIGQTQALTLNNLEREGLTFKGWHTSRQVVGSSNIVYIDEQSVTDLTTTNGATVTLYAVWDFAYAIGDTGPGGGIIFYIAPAGSGFTVEASPAGTPPDRAWAEYTAYYLEAAPANEASTAPWVPVPFNEIQIPGVTALGNANTELGKGRKDTWLIVNHTELSGTAAQVCTAKTTNVFGTDFNDWFLPSVGELRQLYLSRNNASINILNDEFWSSSQSSNFTHAWLLNFGVTTDSYSLTQVKNFSYNVRAIRAF
ncbi:MAG: YDG domain-containing protein [Treponema sp.]|jgi:hypothetical protein|nr:YDG domain-containing protein [Treponema sp.]